MNPRSCIRAGLCLAVMAAALSACFKPKRVQPLSEAVRTYNDGIRWLRFQNAAAHVPPDRRDDFLDQRDQLTEDLRITGYRVVRVRYDNTGHRARVHLKFTWYLDSHGVVHDTHTVQTWMRHSAGWVLLDEQHLRGEPMPGVEADEPGAEPADESSSDGLDEATSDEPAAPGGGEADDALR